MAVLQLHSLTHKKGVPGAYLEDVVEASHRNTLKQFLYY